MRQWTAPVVTFAFTILVIALVVDVAPLAAGVTTASCPAQALQLSTC
jgi:hypothetical protein